MRNRRKKAPRRAGLSCLWTRRARARRRSFCAQRRALAPKRIVYISCNPETQARDVEFLDSIGYAVVAVQPSTCSRTPITSSALWRSSPVDSLSPDRRGKEGGEEEAADAEADEAPEDDWRRGAADEAPNGEAPDVEVPAVDSTDVAAAEEVE